MTEKEKLIDLVIQNEEIQRYKRIEKVINDNKNLKAKFNQLKAIQKQMINAKQIGKQQAIIEFEKRYQTLLDEIESYPLMSDYLALQGDINEMLQQVQSIIEEGIEKDFNQ
ncbi:MAG: hypothetical protein CVV58_05760 [Tenericutes bacterium HGW-Tenericutes-3]|nr:MAG: hypothetical protein CVV58_05760 [Tenericutes bacterium HGW-Tenericutes-3]